jgi:valyl-tRNA synthetase
VLSRIRKAKSEAKVGMRTEVESATIAADAAGRTRIESAQRDLAAAGRIQALAWVAADALDVVDVTLAPPPQ